VSRDLLVTPRRRDPRVLYVRERVRLEDIFFAGFADLTTRARRREPPRSARMALYAQLIPLLRIFADGRSKSRGEIGSLVSDICVRSIGGGGRGDE